MDFLKAPSMQSLLDSDLESVTSFQGIQDIEFEELDEIEYALPVSEEPTLDEVLLDEDDLDKRKNGKCEPEPSVCSALQVEFLQAVSQQLLQAQDRSQAGAATAVGVGSHSRLTVGTAHGHLLSFHEQILRWVCDANSDEGAVTCLEYNDKDDRILVGYARGLICQYESNKGIIVRRITLGGDLWGILRVAWAGPTGLALDTGGSVWLMKFSRPLGVRSVKTSCLFSGARGEVVAMLPRDSRVLALATLSRAIVVAGGRAAAIKIEGPQDCLPALTWCKSDPRLLLCGRGHVLHWFTIDIGNSAINIRCLRRYDLNNSPLWIGWIGGSLAIVDSSEQIRLWDEDFDKPVDISQVEPLYASAFFKGVWTDGRVSQALSAAGAGALSGFCARSGTLLIVGRRGTLRVSRRDIQFRARALFAVHQYVRAMRLLLDGSKDVGLAAEFVNSIADKPELLKDDVLVFQLVELCFKFNLREELWDRVWEQGSTSVPLGIAIARALVREPPSIEEAPSPHRVQSLLLRLADSDVDLLERLLTSLPLTAIDPHAATLHLRANKLWRPLGAVASLLGGSSAAMRELSSHVRSDCVRAKRCECAGDALCAMVVDAMDARNMPEDQRPSARHDAMHALLHTNEMNGIRLDSPLCVMVRHDAESTVQVLRQCWPNAPFVGPLGKQNRLKVAKAILQYAEYIKMEDKVKILEFISEHVKSCSLPADRDLLSVSVAMARDCDGDRADRALYALVSKLELTEQDLQRPRIAWAVAAEKKEHTRVFDIFFRIHNTTERDVDELCDYINANIKDESFRTTLANNLSAIVLAKPKVGADFLAEHFVESIPNVLEKIDPEKAIDLAESLLEREALRGDAAAIHLKNLCELRANDVESFVEKHRGVVRPEECLSIVRKFKVKDAEPFCLEAMGDAEAALVSRLQLAKDSPLKSEFHIKSALSLCLRASASCSRATCASMWTRLLSLEGSLPEQALLSALPHVPPERLLMSASKSSALALLRSARAESSAWRLVASISHRDLSASSATARRVAAKGVSVWSSRCGSCGVALSSGPAAICCGHSNRAEHSHCDRPCLSCSTSVRVSSSPNDVRPARILDHDLLLVASPRPDLEGLV